MSREFSSLNLALSTYCSMACPDCCLDVPHRNKQHYPWSYFEHAAKYLRGAFTCVVLTGGEASIHPHFREYAPKLRALLDCDQLNIETNGFGLTRFPEAYSCFDRVVCTVYTPQSFPGCLDNRPAIEAFRAHPNGSRLVTGLTTFTSRDRRGSGSACNRYGLLAYFDGLLYGCCVAPGVDATSGIPLDENWRSRIRAAPVPCKDCFFG